MIDDPWKTDVLMKGLKGSLPIETNISQRLEGVLAKQSPDILIPCKCNVIDVFYAGDEGGIVCCLDIGGRNTKTAHLVSITHLTFDRRVPLAREIGVYQRHRIKKMKQQTAS